MNKPFGTNEVGSACQSCPSGNQIGSTPAQQDVDPKTHWIAIELVGEDDQPIPRKQYCITLPDGAEVYGYLDQDGKALVTGIESLGDCKICFPELDQEAWERI